MSSVSFCPAICQSVCFVSVFFSIYLPICVTDNLFTLKLSPFSSSSFPNKIERGIFDSPRVSRTQKVRSSPPHPAGIQKVKGSHFKAWSRSEYTFASSTNSQEFYLSHFFLPRSFHFILANSPTNIVTRAITVNQALVCDFLACASS